MNARELTRALGGSWHSSYGMCLCPTHDDGRTPGLKITDDERKGDGIDLHCFAGCDWRDVKAELQERGLLPTIRRSSRHRLTHRRCRPPDAKPADRNQHSLLALEIWRASVAATDTKVEIYLRARAITLPPPPSLRFHPNLTYTPTGTAFPAMVAAVQGADRKITAIHRTYLLASGEGKAPLSSPKMALGPLESGAVRLAKAEKELGLAEGIETALSAMQLFDVPCWAALGSRLDKVWLPDIVRRVVIYADNGESGLQVANKAVETFTAQARKVMLRLPPDGYGDWNDTLQALEREQAA